MIGVTAAHGMTLVSLLRVGLGYFAYHAIYGERGCEAYPGRLKLQHAGAKGRVLCSRASPVLRGRAAVRLGRSPQPATTSAAISRCRRLHP
jgi:hypothetical protein